MAKATKKQTEVLNRIDLNEDFSDVDGDLTNEFALTDAEGDEDKHFVWVHNDPEAIREYRDHVLKYEPVTVNGAVPTRRDHVLYACDRARFEKRQRYEKVRDLKERALLTKAAQKTLKPYELGA